MRKRNLKKSSRRSGILKILFLVLLPEIAVIIWGILIRGDFAIGGEFIFPIFGLFYLVWSESEPVPETQDTRRRAQIEP